MSLTCHSVINWLSAPAMTSARRKPVDPVAAPCFADACLARRQHRQPRAPQIERRRLERREDAVFAVAALAFVRAGKRESRPQQRVLERGRRCGRGRRIHHEQTTILHRRLRRGIEEKPVGGHVQDAGAVNGLHSTLCRLRSGQDRRSRQQWANRGCLSRSAGKGQEARAAQIGCTAFTARRGTGLTGAVELRVGHDQRCIARRRRYQQLEEVAPAREVGKCEAIDQIPLLLINQCCKRHEVERRVWREEHLRVARQSPANRRHHFRVELARDAGDVAVLGVAQCAAQAIDLGVDCHGIADVDRHWRAGSAEHKGDIARGAKTCVAFDRQWVERTVQMNSTSTASAGSASCTAAMVTARACARYSRLC